MRGIFSVLVENRSGVLSKTAGLFARRDIISTVSPSAKRRTGKFQI